MTNAEELINVVSSYNPKTKKSMLRDAFNYGKNKHEGQLRRSGEPYFVHPVAVAMILAEQKLDDASIVTALLHDTLEDTRSTKKEIEKKFNSEIAELVDGVTKLTNMQLSSSETKEAENIRKLLMAMAQDVRVILVKLADRLHNMKTIRSMPTSKQLQKAKETMEIFAPLAGRMGMQSIREDLEDLAFKILNPEGRASIIRRFITLQKATGDVVDRITGDMRNELGNEGILAKVYGRAKKPYSIWRKMQEKGLAFSKLSDIYGFRIITENEADCYKVLGVIHRRWRAVPGRFKDYISQPKSNGYRSIHTTVSGRDGKQVEVQVRTQQMNEIAESGVAAHWGYRDGERIENPFSVDPYVWINALIEQFDSDDDHDAFIEAVKLEMYSDKVFCFTPKGDVIKLPKGATLIDFAYAIHTRIGNRCVGAKVNGLRVPLWTRLRNGQSVEIITAKGQNPQGVWLEIAETGKAKTSIRRALRDADRKKHIVMGQELARVAFEHIGKKATEKALETAARKLRIKDVSELLARLGNAEIRARDVVEAVYTKIASKNHTEVDMGRAVIGLETGQSFTRPDCCQALPGERIVGIIVEGKGVAVHTIYCNSLSNYEEFPERWLDLHWHSGKHGAVYSVTLDMTLANDAGALGRVCTLIGELQANISDLEFIERNPDFYRLNMNVDFRDIEHFNAIFTVLEAEIQIASLERLRRNAANLS